MDDRPSAISHQPSSVRRFADLEALSRSLVDNFADLAHSRSRFCVALSGGHTPKRFYELLSERGSIDWGKVHLFLGDERYVSPDDSRSNERMIRETLVGAIDISPANVHPVYDPEGWEESARRYSDLLHRFFDGQDHTFDLALQGMGDDGHTASIFPGRRELAAGIPGSLPADPWAIPTPGPPESPERISCTLDCLAASRQVIFLVDGEAKAQRLKQVLSGDLQFPAAVLASKAKHVQWWVDDAAASLL